MSNTDVIIETQMHNFICAWCDNETCVRGTDKCEFEQWKMKHEAEKSNEEAHDIEPQESEEA